MAHEFHEIKYLDKNGDLVRTEKHNEPLHICESFAKMDLKKPWYNSFYYIITPITEEQFNKLTTV